MCPSKLLAPKFASLEDLMINPKRAVMRRFEAESEVFPDARNEGT